MSIAGHASVRWNQSEKNAAWRAWFISAMANTQPNLSSRNLPGCFDSPTLPRRQSVTTRHCGSASPENYTEQAPHRARGLYRPACKTISLHNPT